MANTYGLTSVTYGVPTITGFVVQSYDLNKKPEVIAEVINESGVRKHVRYDSEVHEVSLDMIVNGGTEPSVGSVLTYDGIKYEVLDVGIKGSNKDFVKLSVKAKKSTGVTLP